MKRKFDLRRRKLGVLPPEKLLNILRGMYPLEIADEKFEELTGTKLADGGVNDEAT